MATKLDVIRMHALNPTWTTTRIAIEIGTTCDYVRATAYRCELPIPGLRTNPCRVPRPAALIALGVLAHEAGLTVDDLKAFAAQKRRMA